jgi:hypothetical protein
MRAPHLLSGARGCVNDAPRLTKLTTKAPPSIAMSTTLLHRVRLAVAGGRGGSGRFIGAAERVVLFWRLFGGA